MRDILMDFFINNYDGKMQFHSMEHLQLVNGLSYQMIHQFDIF